MVGLERARDGVLLEGAFTARVAESAGYTPRKNVQRPRRIPERPFGKARSQLIPRSLAAVPPRIAILSASLKPGIDRT